LVPSRQDSFRRCLSPIIMVQIWIWVQGCSFFLVASNIYHTMYNVHCTNTHCYLQCCGAGAGLFGPFGAGVVLNFFSGSCRTKFFFVNSYIFSLILLHLAHHCQKTFQKNGNTFLYLKSSLLSVFSNTKKMN